MNLEYGTYQELVENKAETLKKTVKAYLTPPQVKIIKLAYEVASHAHYGQKRKSGEPYITHPTEVATLIGEWGLDEQAVCAALLHDVVEDTNMTKGEISQIFGSTIAELVDGVTKLDKLNFESEEVANAEYFRKVVLAMAKDVRVILIKLADRLHNLSTLGSLNNKKQCQIALETLEIYVPIAHRIGLHKIHLKLADESFKYLFPLRYEVLSKAIKVAHEKRWPNAEKILQNIEGVLKSNGIQAIFVHRPKSIYTIYRRMLYKQQSFRRIYDIFEIKIIVKNIRDCYLTLGVLHSLYQPLPGKFKDYIAIPKSNGYQSIHSTLMGPTGTPIEIHIRTEAMEEIAENGIISHWLKHQNDEEFSSANQRTSKWLDNILDIQSSTFSANEFLASIKQDLSPRDVYVFTPKGKIVLLPQGSTPLDFAYHIHTDIGNSYYSARVNQKAVKNDTRLRNGDIVEIITKDEVKPREEWLNWVVSGKAMSKIKQYIKEQRYEEDVNNGSLLLEKILRALNRSIILSDEMLEQVAKDHFPKLSVNELKREIGNGNIQALSVIRYVLGYGTHEVIDLYLDKCEAINVIQDLECLPLPGVLLAAHMNRDGDLILHSNKCKLIKSLGVEKFNLVNIINNVEKKFLGHLETLIENKPGVFNQFTSIIANKNINIETISQQQTQEMNLATVKVTLNVNNKLQFDDLLESLSQASFIKSIHTY